MEIQVLAVSLWTAFATGAREDARRQMEAATEMEDKTEKIVMAPESRLPAREMLGEMRLAINEPAKALEQFEATLKNEPPRFHSLYGAARAAQLSGNRDTSQKHFFRELL